MDSSQPSHNSPPTESGIGSDAGSQTSNVSESPVMPSSVPEDSVSPAPVISQQSQPDSEPETRPSTPPTRESDEVEHAYWAEYEEDTTTPDEEELKEIEGSEADYSACDRMLHPIP